MQARSIKYNNFLSILLQFANSYLLVKVVNNNYNKNYYYLEKNEHSKHSNQ